MKYQVVIGTKQAVERDLEGIAPDRIKPIGPFFVPTQIQAQGQPAMMLCFAFLVAQKSEITTH